MNLERRARLRLLLRDVSAAAAFGSIVISGSVPLWATVAFGAGLVAALSGRRVLTRRAGVSAIVLAGAAVLLFGNALQGRLDLVVAACTFAALVTMHRMLTEPTPTTSSQVLLTGLLMVAGGAALSAELLFGAFLAVFSLSASLSLGLATIDGSAPPQEDVPIGPMLRRLSLGAFVAILGALAFFVLFPRLSWNVAARRMAPGLGGATTGFAERVRLGGQSGSIKSNPRAVLRATISPDPGRDELSAYWLGRTFDTFDGREWSGAARTQPPRQLVELGPRAQARTVQQRIDLLPAYGARTLVALETPVQFSSATALGLGPGRGARLPLVEVQDEEVRVASLADALTYVALSQGGPLARPLEEGERARNLQLPRLDERVVQLAASLIPDPSDPLQAAERVRAHLAAYRYTLELEGDPPDPLAFFLFERRAGHCEHFATALAVLLRARGIPARVAAGFFGGQRIAGQYVVRAGDAHAWTQVYVDGRGFVSVDATPEAFRAAAPNPVAAWMARAYEALDALWRTRVVDYSLADQARMVQTLVRPPRSSGGAPRLRLPRPTMAWLVVAVGAIALYVVWRLPRARGPSTHEATRLLSGMERLLRRGGVRPAPHEDIETLLRRLGERHPLHVPLARGVRRYLEARYGDRALAKGEARALLDQLAKALPRAQR